MSSQSTAEPASRSTLQKVVAASMAGTVVEWYEFFLYGSAATLVFNKILFPPSENPLTPILTAFITYAVGFLARPLGGLIFGHFGDKYGRKKLLQLSIVLVGASTFLMGCLPTYSVVGLAAPIILVILRFIQGFAVGGEWGGAVLLTAEHSPNESRGFWASWPQAGVPIGNLLSSAILFLMTAILPEDQFLGWGWRVGFWASVIIVAFGYWIRSLVSDAPIFKETQEEVVDEGVKYGVAEVFKRYPRGVFCAMGLRFIENVFYYLVVTWSITYLTVKAGVGSSEILGLLLGANAIEAVLVPLVGKLGDVIGRRAPYAIGIVLAAAWPFFAFPLFDTAHGMNIFIALVTGLIAHALMYSGQPAIMAEMFPTRMRYSGVSAGYQVTSIVAGSLLPIIATALLDKFDSWLPVGFYIIFAAVIGAVSLIFTRETKGIDLNDVDKFDLEMVRNKAGER